MKTSKQNINWVTDKSPVNYEIAISKMRDIVEKIYSGAENELVWLLEHPEIYTAGTSSNNSDLIAVVGPCIKKENYEVGMDLLKKFTDKNLENEKFFEKISNEKYLFDLRGFINNEISHLSIKSIENIEKDTFSENEFFYSYRRSCYKKEKDYGRCISVILMT